MAINLNQVHSPGWSRRTKRTIVLICLAVAGLLLWQVVEILPLVIVSVLLAYLLTPLVNFNEQVLLRWLPFARRGWSVALAFFVVVMLIVLVLIIVLPVLFRQVEEFGRSVPRVLNNIEVEAQRILSEPLAFNGEEILLDGKPIIPLERLQEVTGVEGISGLFQLENLNLPAAVQGFLGSVGGLTGPAFSFLGGAFTAALNITFLLVMVFYLTKDGDKFLTYVVELAPTGYQSDTRRLFIELGLIWNAYLRGQLILCVTIGTVVFIAATLLGLPNAPILGLVAGILEFIPAIGPALAMVLAILLALVSTSATIPILSGTSFALVVIVVWSVIQNLEAFFVVPRVMGDNLNLHPFAVIVAVIAGASLGGAPGVILAAPSLATGRLGAQYIYNKLMDRDPFPARQNVRTTGTMTIVRVTRNSSRRFIQFVNGVRARLTTQSVDAPHSPDSAQS
ncbi:MAG: AI-2E family transporter [Anaerolineae bacterium]|nr:AI-2E family transporter [Anaerolineae bacterium]